jgi:hypothetical protein
MRLVINVNIKKDVETVELMGMSTYKSYCFRHTTVASTWKELSLALPRKKAMYRYVNAFLIRSLERPDWLRGAEFFRSL